MIHKMSLLEPSFELNFFFLEPNSNTNKKRKLSLSRASSPINIFQARDEPDNIRLDLARGPPSSNDKLLFAVILYNLLDLPSNLMFLLEPEKY